MEITRRLFPIGTIGAVLAVAGLLAYAMVPEKIWLVSLSESAASICLIIFFVLHFETFKTFSTRRATRMGANSLLMVLIFVCILVILNFLAARHSQRWDFSEGQRFTLAPQTFRVLRGLHRDIMIKVFTHERSQNYGLLRDLLDTYRQSSSKLTVEFIDPDRQPNLAREHGITKLDTVILTGNSQTMRVNGPSEVELTGAIIRLSRDTKKRILFLDGHGERSIEDKERGGLALAKEALTKQGYQVGTLSLVQETSVPEDAAVLAIAGPNRLVTKGETESIAKYVAQGGRLLILIDPDTQAGLDDLLRTWGIEMGPGIIVDFQDRMAQASPTFLLARRFVTHDITQDLKSFVLFPDSRPIRELETAEWESIPLVQTSPQSRAVRDSKGGVYSLNEKEDVKGPLPIAVVVTPKQTPAEEQPRPAIVAIGNSLFASNVYFNVLGNPDFFLNTISWLAKEPELISITAKDPGFRPFIPNPLQNNIVLYMQVFALPILAVVVGTLVWKKRRNL